MAGDRDDRERIREAADLVELFEGVTKVQKVRGSYKALCPFHAEKTPSLSIDPVRGLYHCFGCKAGGDVFSFVQQTQGLSFPEAVETLADRYGVAIRRNPQAKQHRQRRTRLVQAVTDAGKFYEERLKVAPDAGAARAYVRSRDYDIDVVEKFQLGYAPRHSDELFTHLRNRKYTETEIKDAGLGRRARTGGLFDPMRGRLMFPIHNVRGEMVGFGGRLLSGEGPKYLNTPETSLYKKGELLYGLDKARTAISRADRAIVVEGYTDVIAFHLIDLPEAVATCGTALGDAHFDSLRRFAGTILLAFDADAAGVGAAIRGDELRITSDLDLELKITRLPDGQDPADLVHGGRGDLLKDEVNRSIPITRFRVERALLGHDLQEREARTKAMRECAALIARHPDRVVQHQYAVYVADRTETPLVDVLSVVKRSTGGRKARTSANSPPPSRPAPAVRLERSERDLLRHLLAGTAEVSRVAVDFFESGAARRLAGWLSEVAQRQGKEVPVSLDGLKEEDLAVLARELSLLEEPIIPFDDAVDHLAKRAIARRKRALMADIKPDDRDRYLQVQQEVLDLERTLTR